MSRTPGMTNEFCEFTLNTNPSAALKEMGARGAHYGVVFDNNGSPAMLLTEEDFTQARAAGVRAIPHHRAKLPPTIVMPEEFTLEDMLADPAVTLLEHGARGAIVARQNKVLGVVGAEVFMHALGSGNLAIGGRQMAFEIPDSQLAGKPQQRGFGNVVCRECGYLNRVRILDRDHLPKCQNPEPPEHALKL
jgi:hypothetical protein